MKSKEMQASVSAKYNSKDFKQALEQIDEYVLPIEYPFDPVTTTFAEDGRLKTIDGFTTADEFLVRFSETDGYKGTIDVNARTANGYYPVYVNSEGYGVWAYLCTYSEIIQNIHEKLMNAFNI